MSSQNCEESGYGHDMDQWTGRIDRQLQMNRLSLRNNQLKFKTSGQLPMVLEESMEDISNQSRETERSHMYPLGLGNTRISTAYAQTSPRTLIWVFQPVSWQVGVGNEQWESLFAAVRNYNDCCRFIAHYTLEVNFSLYKSSIILL